MDTNYAEATDEALDTVESAQILGLDTIPSNLTAGISPDGDLPVGTWYYRVSAVGDFGESLCSPRKMVLGQGGAVTLNWDSVAGAQSYMVYRNADKSGNTGDVRLLASDIEETTFTDTGSLSPDPSGVSPLPSGSLSLWKTLGSSMITQREGLDTVVVEVPSDDEQIPDKTFLYAVGGRPDATGTGYLTSGERAQILEDGSLGAFVALSTALNTPRAFYSLLTNQGQSESGFNDEFILRSSGFKQEPDPLYLIAIAGDSAHSGNNNQGLTTFEVTEISTVDGDISVWTEQGAALPGGGTTYAHASLLYFDYLFIFAGVSVEDIGDYPSINGQTFQNFNFVLTPDQTDGVLTSGSAVGGSLDTARAYFEMVRVGGHLWAIGGTAGSVPLASIERILQ